MLSLRIALRYLFAKKTHAAVNVISWISVAVVSVASAAIVVVLSVFNGFTDLAVDHLSVLDPPLKVYPSSGKVIGDADSLAAVIGRTAGVDAVMPVIEERGLLVSGTHQQPVVFLGVEDDFTVLSGIDSALVDGVASFMTTDGRDCMSLSVGVAVATGLRASSVGQAALYVPRRLGKIQPSNPATAFRGDSLVVSSVFQVNQPEYDNEFVIIPIGAARRLLDYDAEATAMNVYVSSKADAGKVADILRSLLGSGYEVKDRIGQQEKSFRMIAIEKWITFMMLAFILLVASFNIISTLSMLVLEKRDNLDTLRCLGAPRQMVSRIFVWQGWLISFIGALIGLVLGVGLTLAQQYGGFIRLNADPSSLTVAVYPVRLAFADLLVLVVVAAFIGLLTSRVTAYFIRNQLK